MLGYDAVDLKSSAGRRGKNHISTGLNHIWNYRIRYAMKLFNAADLYYIGARSADLSAARIEEIGGVNNVRFVRGIFDYGNTVRLYRGKHCVDRASDRDDIHIYGRTLKSAGSFGVYISVLNCHIGSECFEAFNMLIYRAYSEITAARITYMSS
ncbi:hypothetical protein SDC9_172480 [bioreactor metagenome]|uniref:Uncharacterized protein n=1 Tax=bioreactor metagenome TaxID=1076179 RepID=A0A645GMZ3_9ZZZZ